MDSGSYSGPALRLQATISLLSLADSQLEATALSGHRVHTYLAVSRNRKRRGEYRQVRRTCMPNVDDAPSSHPSAHRLSLPRFSFFITSCL
jgi:hypothetical protein